MCQKDSSNLTHTVCFDVSIYNPIGEPDVTNKRMIHLLKLDTFFHTHDARIMTHDATGGLKVSRHVAKKMLGGHKYFLGKGTILHLLHRKLI